MNDFNEDLTDEEYFNRLADEANESESDEDDADVLSDDDYSKSHQSEPLKYKHKLNKPLLIVGIVMVIVVVFVNKNKGEVSSNKVNPVVTIQEETTLNSNTEVKDIEPTTSLVQVNEEVIFTEDETYIEPIKGEHLTELPVVVTEEVDTYFKQSVSVLRVALSIDTFIANNTIYNDNAMQNSLSKLIADYEEKQKSFNELEVPEGCEDYSQLVKESLDSYSYYFTEVESASAVSSEEEFNQNVKAAISYVQVKMSGLKDISDTWEPVFIYYGLFQ